MRSFVADLRHSIRVLLNSPGFTADILIGQKRNHCYRRVGAGYWCQHGDLFRRQHRSSSAAPLCRAGSHPACGTQLSKRHGFLVVNNVLTTIDYPGSTRTSIVQVNDRGQAVGIGRIPSEGPTTPYGFVWENGVFTGVSFPGAFGTGLDGINEQGDVCGFTTDEAGGLTHAMMRLKGVFSHVEPAGAIDSLALSINDRGQVAGWYDDALGNTHGFIYSGGVFTTIDVPGSLGSEVTSIQNNGLITGDYISADGVEHGFIGTPIIGTAAD